MPTTTTTPKKTTTTKAPKATAPKAATTPKVTSKTKTAATVQVNDVKPTAQVQTQPTKTQVSWEQRQQMIQVAAYLKAQKRGFQDGNELADWIAAEKEVNQLIAN